MRAYACVHTWVRRVVHTQACVHACVLPYGRVRAYVCSIHMCEDVYVRIRAGVRVFTYISACVCAHVASAIYVKACLGVHMCIHSYICLYMDITIFTTLE